MKFNQSIISIRTTAEKWTLYRGAAIKGKRYTYMHFISTNGGKSYKAAAHENELYATKAEALTAFRNHVNPITLALFDGLCTNHGGKMSGVVSFSTLCDMNPRCIERMKAGNSICAHCFAHTQLKRQATHRAKLARNTSVITASLYSASYFPIIDGFKQFRLESFGDLINPIQAANYMTWVSVNKHMSAALWTKNPDIAFDAIAKLGAAKPANMNIVYSSPALNTPASNVRRLYILPDGAPMIDKIFTVYTPEYIKEHSIAINCGARSCKACRRCYRKNTAVDVREKLK